MHIKFYPELGCSTTTSDLTCWRTWIWGRSHFGIQDHPQQVMLLGRSVWINDSQSNVRTHKEFVNALELIQEFHLRYSNKPKPSSCIVTRGTRHQRKGWCHKMSIPRFLLVTFNKILTLNKCFYIIIIEDYVVLNTMDDRSMEYMHACRVAHIMNAKWQSYAIQCMLYKWKICLVLKHSYSMLVSNTLVILVFE